MVSKSTARVPDAPSLLQIGSACLLPSMQLAARKCAAAHAAESGSWWLHGDDMGHHGGRPVGRPGSSPAAAAFTMCAWIHSQHRGLWALAHKCCQTTARLLGRARAAHQLQRALLNVSLALGVVPHAVARAPPYGPLLHATPAALRSARHRPRPAFGCRATASRGHPLWPTPACTKPWRRTSCSAPCS
jgi:hypothetical protein